MSTHQLLVQQFQNWYYFFFLVFLCCLENSCFLIRFSLETKILIIFLSVFCPCINNVKSLVDNYREVVNKKSFVAANTAVVCCMHPPSLVFPRVGTELTRFNIFHIIPSCYRVVNEAAPCQPTSHNQALIRLNSLNFRSEIWQRSLLTFLFIIN